MNSGADRFDTLFGRAQKLWWMLLGTVVGLQQTFLATSAQPILIGFAALCLGLPLARSLDKRGKDGVE